MRVRAALFDFSLRRPSLALAVATLSLFLLCSPALANCGSNQNLSCPPPTMTVGPVTANSITVYWSVPSTISYSFYQVGWQGLRPQGGLTRQQSGQISGSQTYFNISPLIAGETYSVQVQGCYSQGFAAPSLCSGWATKSVTTSPCPSPTVWDAAAGQCVLQIHVCGTAAQPCQALPPQDLQAGPSGGFIKLGWAIPTLVNGQVRRATVSRTPAWPNNTTTMTLAPPNLTSMTDELAVAGTSYSYQVCLVYGATAAVFQPSPDCASVTAALACPSGQVANGKGQCVAHRPPLGPIHLPHP